MRKRFLDFNKKIANLWKKPEFAGEKPEFETKEINFLAGKKYITKGVDGFFPHQFLRENEKTIEGQYRTTRKNMFLFQFLFQWGKKRIQKEKQKIYIMTLNFLI